MSKGEDKRQAIFDAYRDNLNLLVDNGFIGGKKDIYICPICLKPHNDLNSEDPLTLEDAPPKSLGGSSNTLTCKSCNNTCGHKIDFHLTERLRELDSKKFLPNTETKVKVKVAGETFHGKIIIDANGIMKIFHSRKNNHPEKLEEQMEELKGGEIVDLNFLMSRVIPENLEYALLKTGYILLFQKFGYSLILNNCYNIIRDQLRNPDNRIYPEGFWFCPSYPKKMNGVYFICDKGLECILILFNLDTGKTERMFGTLLPLPIHSINKIISEFNKKFEQVKEIVLELYPLEQTEMKYLFDIDNLKAMYDWIEKRQNLC